MQPADLQSWQNQDEQNQMTHYLDVRVRKLGVSAVETLLVHLADLSLQPQHMSHSALKFCGC